MGLEFIQYRVPVRNLIGEGEALPPVLMPEVIAAEFRG